MDQHNEIPDWNRDEEEVPPALRRKWEEEDENAPEPASEQDPLCRSCGNPVRQKALLCLYCGGPTGIKVGLFSHLRSFLTENLWGLIIFLAILSAVTFLLVL